MSDESKTVREQIVGEFVRNLARLDDGERARLKRNAGKSLSESRQVQLLFYSKVLPHGISSEQQENLYFLIATLYPFDREQRERDRGAAEKHSGEAEERTLPALTLGNSLRHARTEENRPGLDRRFARLLDADSEQLPFQLRQAIKLLADEHRYINWAQLTRDVLAWSHSSRYVQRRWARDYVSAQESANQ